MRNVVVTGGTRGLGLGIVRSLLRAEYRVIAIGRTPSDNFAAVKFDYPNRLQFIEWDLQPSTCDFAALTKLIRSHGHVYGLVNNAGLGLSGILTLTMAAKIEQTIALNVLSPILLTRALLNSMMVERIGRIINISSIVANTGYQGLSVYSATKAAMIGFTHSLAREVGSLGITVNAVAPGFLDTEMTHELTQRQKNQIMRRSALGSMATVEDVAATVRFLMGESAAHITGTTITVDAGNTA